MSREAPLSLLTDDEEEEEEQHTHTPHAQRRQTTSAAAATSHASPASTHEHSGELTRRRTLTSDLSVAAKRSARAAILAPHGPHSDADFVSSGRCLRIDPGVGDEVAFFVNRVLGQSNRGALRLSQILSGDVERCVMCNYCIELDWMMDEACPQMQLFPRVDVVTVRDRDTHGRPLTNKHPIFKNVTYFTPPLPISFGVHHSKILLLFYRTGIRVALTTANFISIDWVWKNNVSYVQDFPRKTAASPPTSMFEKDLVDYFRSYARSGLDVTELAQFDFSSAKVILIPSVPGRHQGESLHKYGHMKLRRVLSEEVLPDKFAKAPITAQFSSIGNISETWLMNEIRTSFAASKNRHTGSGASASAASASLPPMHLIWPTVSSVRDSLEGWHAGASLCCDSKNQKSFFRPLLHRWDGRAQDRDRAMPHIKSYVRAAPDGEIAWILITSANLSNSAWGQMQLAGKQLQIRHYELGCLFTPTHYAKAMQIIKQQGIVNFTCTPDQPIMYSPKGDRAKIPYFLTDRTAAAASSSAPSATGSPATSSDHASRPPRVRFVILPGKSASESATQQPDAHSQHHAGTKRAHDEAGDGSGAKRQKTTVVTGESDTLHPGATEEPITIICPLPYECCHPQPYTARG